MASLLSAGDLRVQRCVWLYSRLAHRGTVDFPAYNRRFAASDRSYRRDLTTLQRIGVGFESVRDHGRVKFVRESL